MLPKKRKKRFSRHVSLLSLKSIDLISQALEDVSNCNEKLKFAAAASDKAEKKAISVEMELIAFRTTVLNNGTNLDKMVPSFTVPTLQGGSPPPSGIVPKILPSSESQSISVQPSTLSSISIAIVNTVIEAKQTIPSHVSRHGNKIKPIFNIVVLQSFDMGFLIGKNHSGIRNLSSACGPEVDIIVSDVKYLSFSYVSILSTSKELADKSVYLIRQRLAKKPGHSDIEIIPISIGEEWHIYWCCG